ncbi:MAG TPA: S41 family peptidase [Balneolales bacterium]|nr:S41 family peptidase [Balneolales bacterium]
MKIWKRSYLGIVALSLVVMTSIGFTYYSDLFFQIKKSITIFSDVFREVSLNYVDPVNPEKIMETGIDAMLSTLDPYTVFIDESDNQEINIITRGKYAGVGLEVGARGGNLVVIAPLDGYPAYRKGVKAGDIILQVNDHKVTDLSPEELQNQLRGEPGTHLSLTVKRYNVEQPITFNLVREVIVIHNVTYYGYINKDKTIGYILLSHFSENAGEEVKQAIKKLRETSDLKGLILDLRNNPGGLLSEAVNTLDNFVKPGVEVVRIKGRDPESNTPYYSSGNPLYLNKPLIILQNHGSASASEIVTGALQDLDRAVIVGTNSFGKGLVQVIRPLSYNTALKITTAKYYTPSGRCIQAINYTHDKNIHNGKIHIPDSLRKSFKTKNGRTVYNGNGIEPDVKLPEGNESLLEIALRQHSMYFFFANKYVSEHKNFNIKLNNDSLFHAFKDFIDRKKFTYETNTGHLLNHLRSQLKQQKLLKQAEVHLDSLQKLVNKQYNLEFEREAPEINKELYLELVSRYQDSKNQIKFELKHDRYVRQAVQILQNKRKYHRLLSYVKN